MITQPLHWYTTTPERAWDARAPRETESETATLALTDTRYQTIRGFGGCFNEMGWHALLGLPEAERNRVLHDLFAPEGGCQLTIGRIPIGASDYALEWYSHDETLNDYALEAFSIARDHQYLLPYIKAALQKQPDLAFFASPWSPPTWMKSPPVYNYGTLRWEEPILTAYAHYLVQFLHAYADEGIHIQQIHVQNEPYSDQKFPSCVWTGEQLRQFIREHLGPLMQQEKGERELWLGTLNDPSYDAIIHTVLSDPLARQYITGIGLQWAGKATIERAAASWPEMRLMQTENECGDGDNSWEYAHYVFTLFRHYLVHGAESYVYWNMVLPPGGRSTWGWQQNALITVDVVAQTIHYNPEFYLMQHFSHFVEVGAERLGVRGQWSGNAVAFANPNGARIVVVNNPFLEERPLALQIDSRTYHLDLPAQSFNTVVLSEQEQAAS